MLLVGIDMALQTNTLLPDWLLLSAELSRMIDIEKTKVLEPGWKINSQAVKMDVLPEPHQRA